MEAVIKQHYTKKSRLIGKFLQWEIVSYCEVEDWLDFLTTDIWTYLILLLNFTIVQFSSHDPRFSPSLKSFSFQSANEYSSVCPPSPFLMRENVNQSSEADERIIPKTGKTKWIMDQNNINVMRVDFMSSPIV